jgi:hypothetical protein
MRDFARRAARYASRWLGRYGSYSEAAVPQLTTSVAETTPVTPRESMFAAHRLNLLVPSINAQHYFGGIHTAIQVFEEMSRQFQACRIVLTDSTPDAAALARFSSYRLVDAAVDSDALRQVVPFADRYGKTLPVARGDHWLATAWWTAHAAQRAAAWQGKTYGTEGRLAYMIQDFEPGFYPWSSQSAMALATYRPSRDVGIFNTSLLADYFEAQGIGYTERLVFEPTINDGLREALAHARKNQAPRKRRIVVYARPSTPRNAFTLICEALRLWGWSDPLSQEWEIVAPGELSGDMDLGPVRLRALGKLGIDAYADLLATSAVGLSLMVSPHPSYPPLEMAAFGMGVVTNGYANKDLSSFSPNIRSVAVMSPEAIAEALSSQCHAWSERAMHPAQVMDAAHPFLLQGGFGELGERASSAMMAD